MLVYSAGIVPVRIEEVPKFLLLRSNTYFDFPKGKLDPGETHLEAALRETLEESGLWDLNFSWGMDYIETLPYQTSYGKKKCKKIARYYIAELMSGEPEIVANPKSGIKEHQEYKWVSYDQAIELPLHSRIRKVLDWAKHTLDET